MSPAFLGRLLLDLVAASLLVFALSYWWLGNLAHEIAGTAMFALVIAHNVFNRRWYGALPRARRDARSLFNIAVTALLAAAMLVLLVTSLLISNTLSGVMSAFGGFTARQIHTLAAYWALVIVSVHLGLRWPIIMGVARQLTGLTRPTVWRTALLRLVAALFIPFGLWSAATLGIGTKLSMEMTLDWWNFEESVAAFFLHVVAVAGLCIVLTHYAATAMQALSKRRASRTPVAQKINEHGQAGR